MKKLFFFLMLAATQFANAQQLSNTTFDGTWENCYPWEAGSKVSTACGTQPTGWCVANVAGMIGWGATTVAAEGEGRSGSGKSVVLTNIPNSMSSKQIVPGYMTLGTTWATARAGLSWGGVTVSAADGGAFGGIPFTYHPDAIRLYYKRAHKIADTGVSNETEKASIIAYSWKGTWTQKDVPSNTTMGTPTKVSMTDRDRNVMFGASGTVGGTISSTSDAELIASIEYYIEGNASEWTELIIPFTYKTSSTPEKFNIIIAADDYFADRSNIGGYNQLTVDDVELLYYSELASCSYNGSTVTFTDGTATVDKLYDANKLSITSNGRGATIEKSFNEETQLLTITVKGEDISTNPTNYHTYTIQFKSSSTDPIIPGVVETKTYPEDLYVTIGDETADKQVADVVVETLDNGNINFVLKNFVLAGAMPVGNIAVNNIKVAADGSFTFNGGVAIAAGDDPAYEGEWIGPDITTACGGSVPLDLKGQFLTEDHIVVYINIDIAEFLGYAVEVHLGYDAVPMAVNATAQYGTFCAPFDVEVPAGVTAYTVPSIDGNLLNLQEVGGTIPANTPVVLYAESGLEKVMFFGLAEEGNPVADVLTGVYENTVVPVGSYVLQNLNGKVGFYLVAEGKQPTLGANRCYLTVPAAGVKAFFLNGGDATGISGVDANVDANEAIYNLAGQRINKLQKGINIINGKKILK